MSALWHAAQPYGDVPPEDPYVRYLREEHVENIRHEFIGSGRSLQSEIGSSEIGWECDRRLSYRLHGVLKSNYTNPVPAITGTGWHLYLADAYLRINAAVGGYRYRVEYPCRYRNVLGHGDLYDRRLQVLTDWKTSKKDRIRKMREANTVPAYYRVQVNHNAVALRVEQYETPVRVGLMFIPIDGTLDDSWMWVDHVDIPLVDAAIDRVDRLRSVPPEEAEIHSSRDCGYCAWYDPNSTDPRQACNAKKGTKK